MTTRTNIKSNVIGIKHDNSSLNNPYLSTANNRGNDNGTNNNIKPIIGCLSNQILENGQCVGTSRGEQLDSVCQSNDPNCPKLVCPPTGYEKGSDPIT
ncbi:MAG: hypothetical protein H0X50_07925 [Nitrosopumilus sp.]|nr:hypothetical protein [Nitrosopumilus sp.]